MDNAQVRFFRFQLKIPLLGKFGQKNQNCQFKLKFGTYNHFPDTLRLFGVLPTFLFTVCETMRHYYLQTWYIRVASQVAKRVKT